MGLETAEFIDGLVITNPLSVDPKSQGDDHIRLLKSTVKATFPNVTGAATATQEELNILDGVTASTEELNILDGVTASTAEINLLDGVTASTAELNILDGVTASADEINLLDGVTASTDELNILDGVLATTAQINHIATTTSDVQDQLDAKAPLESPALTGNPTAPTAAFGDNDTSIATTAFVRAEFAPLASPALTGTPTAPTAPVGTSTTQIATTDFVTAAGLSAGPVYHTPLLALGTI